MSGLSQGMIQSDKFSISNLFTNKCPIFVTLVHARPKLNIHDTFIWDKYSIVN